MSTFRSSFLPFAISGKFRSFRRACARVLPPASAIFVLWGLQSTAYAWPITWTFVEPSCPSHPCGSSPVSPTATGVISGSFVFDADTNTYSSVNISVTALSDFSAETYTIPNYSDGVSISNGYESELLLAVNSTASDLTGDPFVGFLFSSALTDAGGESNVFGLEGYCTDSTCSITQDDIEADTGDGNFGIGKSTVESIAPEPLTFGLIGGGLLALAYWMKRTKMSARR